MYIYINKAARKIYVEFSYQLDENNEVGTTWEDYKNGMWVMLSEEQLQFRADNPSASVQEVFNMALTPPYEPTPEQKLRQAQNAKYQEVNEAVNGASHYYIGESDVYTFDRLTIKDRCSINKKVTVNGVEYDSSIMKKAIDEMGSYQDNVNSVAAGINSQIQSAENADACNAIVVEGFPTPISTTVEELQVKVDNDNHRDVAYQSVRLVKKVINNPSVITLTKNEALDYQFAYPYWGEEGAEFGKQIGAGFRLNFKPDTAGEDDDPTLYEAIQESTISEEWKPNEVPALFEVVDIEHAGTIEDPIPWKHNMQLYNGKYYTDKDVLYLCVRDSGIGLSYDLADLVSGGYVTVVEQ